MSGSRGIISSDTLAEQIGFEQQRTLGFRGKHIISKTFQQRLKYRLWGYTSRIKFMGDDVVFFCVVVVRELVRHHLAKKICHNSW